MQLLNPIVEFKISIVVVHIHDLSEISHNSMNRAYIYPPCHKFTHLQLLLHSHIQTHIMYVYTLLFFIGNSYTSMASRWLLQLHTYTYMYIHIYACWKLFLTFYEIAINYHLFINFDVFPTNGTFNFSFYKIPA